MAWSWLWSWFRRRPPTPVVVCLYTRQGCHLCEEAWDVLERSRRRFPFTLTLRDVDTDPELAARYGLEVPVVTVNGKVRFRGRVNSVLLARLLGGKAT